MSILSEKPIVIIGGGPAGYSAALELRKVFAEQKIILIEKNKLGGTCLHVGCIPSKQLHSIKNLQDYPKLLQKNKTILERAVASELKAASIEVIISEASIVEGVVNTSNGDKFEYSHLIIATGSKPRTLKEFPNALTSDSFFSEENLSQGFKDKYCFIGGGYIGLELASMLAYHGKQVRIIEREDNILTFLDEDIRNKLIQELKAQKISITTGVKDLTSVEIAADEQVIVSVGRESISLSTEAENIHLIGDVSKGLALAHYAYAQAKQLATKLAGKKYEIDKAKVPLVIFTHPEVASIGLTEKQAKDLHGDQVQTKVINWASNGKARVSGYDRGMTKWIIHNDKVLGCHIIGHSATDLISIIVPIINMNPNIKDMERWIYPHPTLGEIFSL